MCMSRFNGLLNWLNDDVAPQYTDGKDWTIIGSTGHGFLGWPLTPTTGDGMVPAGSSLGMPGLAHQYLYRDPAYFHYPHGSDIAYYRDIKAASDAHVEWGHGVEGDGRPYQTATGFRFGLLADLAIGRPDR